MQSIIQKLLPSRSALQTQRPCLFFISCSQLVAKSYWYVCICNSFKRSNLLVMRFFFLPAHAMGIQALVRYILPMNKCTIFFRNHWWNCLLGRPLKKASIVEDILSRILHIFLSSTLSYSLQMVMFVGNVGLNQDVLNFK